MVGQIVFNSGGLRANRNVSGKLGMKLAMTEGLVGGLVFTLFIKNLAHYSSH